MEAVRTSETSVHFNVTTRRYNPEDCKLNTSHRDNLKSHIENGKILKYDGPLILYMVKQAVFVLLFRLSIYVDTSFVALEPGLRTSYQRQARGHLLCNPS